MKRNLIKHAGLLFVVISLLLNPIFATPVRALSAPSLIAPGNDAVTTPVDTPPLAIPEFKWAAVSGATKYRLQVSSDIAFTTRLVDITTPSVTYTPSSVSGFGDGTWYWRVRVETPAPVSEYSETWNFTKEWATPENAPTLNYPLDSANLDFYEPPVFSWEPVTGAAEYKLQIYSSPGGWSTLDYTATTLATTHQPTDKLANGTYYWRVVPVDAAAHVGTPSEERSFTADYNFVPVLLEPADLANPVFTPTFRWTAVRGAQYYKLQYSTDPSFSVSVTNIDTRNTSHTPTSTIPNDVNYYWRVRAHSGASVSDWTPTRQFIKRWYIKPVLLTPVNSYQHVRFPLYSWTPVPGASYYKVEISKFANFNPVYDSGDTANTFFSPTKYDGDLLTYYWRVTPYDGSSKAGSTSNTFSYRSYYDSVAPHLVYPLYYYPPDNYPGFPGVTTNPHEDRSVALPIFIWHRVLVPAGDPNQGQVYAQEYRLQVSTDATFTTVNWDVDTENLAATPTQTDSFTPLPNTDYYWRVRPLINGSEVGEWSQIWKTRFDSTKGLVPTATASPSLIRPTTGFEFAETTPLLEWFPLNGASSYVVQISSDENFSTIADQATVSYPAYAPIQNLAQRSLGDLNFGVYYWRVRNSANATWSETRRFQIAAQSQWKYSRALGDIANRLQIGSDAAGDVTANYDVSTLQAAQSSSHWHFGFNVPSSPSQNVTYALYLDIDHLANSGATTDARGYTVTTNSAFRPEYAMYVLQEGGAFVASKVYLYRWTGNAWDTVTVLNNIGGQIIKDGNYVEIQVPNTSIGYQDTTGSYAISLFSLPPVVGLPQDSQPRDSVPSDPLVPGAGPISRFSNVTERLNLAAPPTNAGVNPTTYPSILPFFWDWPILAPWSGAYMKAYLDPLYTTQAATYTLTSADAFYASTSHAWGDDFQGDNTYYWRVQPRYRDGLCDPLCNGAWSQGWRFERKGFIPQNLQTSVTFATPTFSWDTVEGADTYTLQIDTDPGFGTPTSITTTQNSFTDDTTMLNGTYYWRVRVNRDGGISNQYSSSQNFTLALPVPQGLEHFPSGDIVPQAPTLCWSPVIKNSPQDIPVLAAFMYKVQVSKDATFSVIYDSANTEQSCWTPSKGYDDGQYYWRVAMYDGQLKLGNYSPSTTFTKQYPSTTLVSPSSGSTIPKTPTFVWTPVEGAAKYKFEASQNPNFSPVYDTITTHNTRWTPTKSYATMKTYYWRVAIVDADGKLGPYISATITINDSTPVSIYIGPSPTPVGTYNMKSAQSLRKTYALNNGPVQVTAGTVNTLTSQRVIYSGVSYSEMMGLPAEQLSREYLFPYYNNVAMQSQLRVSNLGDVPTTINIFLGTELLDNYELAAGAAQRKSYPNANSGPLRVVSTDANILSTIRVLYGSQSYSELMGLPVEELSQEYWYPVYDNINVSSQLRVSNVGAGLTTVSVYLEGNLLDTFDLLPGEASRTTYPYNTGPLQVISDSEPILSTIRLLYKNASYAELAGLPVQQLGLEAWYPVYDNVSLGSQLRVANTGTGDTTITVFAAGVLIDTFDLPANTQVRKAYAKNTGPLQVISSTEMIVSTVRLVYRTPTFNSMYELMGLPNTELSSQYFFPWYNNSAMNSEMRFALP